MIILINFIQLLSTSESSNDEESPSNEESPSGHEDEEPSRDKSNYSKESSDCNEQIISEGK